jgi:hypothetical protein
MMKAISIKIPQLVGVSMFVRKVSIEIEVFHPKVEHF